VIKKKAPYHLEDEKAPLPEPESLTQHDDVVVALAIAQDMPVRQQR
jgi:hypothetical protein